MFEKYNKGLTVVLIIAIIAIVGLLVFFGIDVYRKYYLQHDAEEAVSQYQEKNKNEDNNNDSGAVDGSSLMESINETDSQSVEQKGSKLTYKGFLMDGTIEIPVIKVKYPVLSDVSKKAIEVAVAVLYKTGDGLNRPGNTVIVGHNYRNGLFFSNVQKLKNGDAIYITDNDGNRMKYTVYNVYQTNPDDFEYAMRDTNGSTEISLSTCTDDGKERTIVWARADQ